MFEFAVGLEHGVRVDGDAGHHLFHRRQLVAFVQQSEPQCLPDLLHELLVGGDAGTRVEVELDH